MESGLPKQVTLAISLPRSCRVSLAGKLGRELQQALAQSTTSDEEDAHPQQILVAVGRHFRFRAGDSDLPSLLSHQIYHTLLAQLNTLGRHLQTRLISF